MLQLSETIVNRDVLSLRTGSPIGQVIAPIINPDNLKIEGFYCNDFDALTDPSELVRLKKLLDMNFELIGKPIETLSHDKVGKVSDYAFESSTMYIQKIYASRSLLKSLTTGSLSIDRAQIQEITPKRIIINDLLQGNRIQANAVAA